MECTLQLEKFRELCIAIVELNCTKVEGFEVGINRLFGYSSKLQTRVKRRSTWQTGFCGIRRTQEFVGFHKASGYECLVTGLPISHFREEACDGDVCFHISLRTLENVNLRENSPST